MTTTRPYSFRHDIGRIFTRFNHPGTPVRVALRNTLAVLLPLVIGIFSGQILMATGVAVGALVVMSADQPGHYKQRLQLIASVTFAGALSAFFGFVTGAHPLLMLLATAIIGFIGGILVVFNPRTTRIGMVSLILFCVATSIHLPLKTAVGASVLILIGGSLQALFSISAWPLRRYHPERLALASLYRDLAAHARQNLSPDVAPPTSDSITTLQRTLLGRNVSRGRAMEAFLTLLSLAERIRLELMALSQAKLDHPIPLVLQQQIGDVLEALASALTKAKPPDTAEQALTKLKQRVAQEKLEQAVGVHIQALIGQLAAAVRNANWAGSQGETRAHEKENTLPSALRANAPWRTIRANLNFSSIAFRHAVRLMVTLVLAASIGIFMPTEHSYWVPMTAVIVLRPDFGATLNFGLLRMVGTIAGLVLTTVLLLVLPHSTWVLLALMALLCFIFRYSASVHYGLAVMALTGVVVILLAFNGDAPEATAIARVINTIIGATLALSAYRVWPSWEQNRVYTALANLAQSYAQYLGCLVSARDDKTRMEARSQARIARSNANASLARLKAEPKSTTKMIQQVTEWTTASHRLIRTAMALQALLDVADSYPCKQEVQTFIQTCENHLLILARALRDRHTPEPSSSLRDQQQWLAIELANHADPEIEKIISNLTDRLTDNIDTLRFIQERAFKA